MKKLLLVLTLISVNAFADQYVNAYDRANGTHVDAYTRSSPNGTTADNYGSRRESSNSYQTQGYPAPSNSSNLSIGAQPAYGIQPLNPYGR
jgi:hypothetical protein